MAIIPLLRGRAMQEAVAFYTRVLDFQCVRTWPDPNDPAFGVLMRDGGELHLSSHSGDFASRLKPSLNHPPLNLEKEFP